jgi:hypothetical protein
MLIKRTGLRSYSKAEIIQLNRNEKAFIDEDKKSIELAEAIFEESSMFCFHDANYFAMDYILYKLISDKKLFDEMKDRGTSIIRLFSLISMYCNPLYYNASIRGGRVAECGISLYCDYTNDFLKQYLWSILYLLILSFISIALYLIIVILISEIG